MPREHSIFDLIGLCTRISEHENHSVTIDYCGLVNRWTYYVHRRSDSEVLQWSKVVDNDPIGDHEQTVQQAYDVLKEYLP